jgi:predicted PurR-regulated permease PerM
VSETPLAPGVDEGPGPPSRAGSRPSLPTTTPKPIISASPGPWIDAPPSGRLSLIPNTPGARRVVAAAVGAAAVALAYTLRGVLAPLFFAFLLAYALDPVVDRLERLRVPRSMGAPLVMLTLMATLGTAVFLGVPFAVDEFRGASQRLPQQVASLYQRAEDLLWLRYHYKLPETWSDLFAKYGSELRGELPDAARIGGAIFGTFGAIFVLLGTLIVPIFALYLLSDFDRIMARAKLLVPRRWASSVGSVAHEIHVTLGRYVRGQLTTNLILAVLYTTGLSLTGIRMAVPIGVLTGLLSFIPYVGLITGTLLATLMALLDWHSTGQLVAVLLVMLSVGLLDGMVITPRIVGGSVGLRPLEVLVTMMATGTLFGFVGVLLAVPIGAVAKILVHRAVEGYLRSSFYRQEPKAEPPGG